MMRVFVAIEITNEAVVNSIRKFQNELEIEAKQVKFRINTRKSWKINA